jgi:hypothetical protein
LLIEITEIFNREQYINVFRISFLVFILDQPYFELTHWIVQQFLLTLAVAGIALFVMHKFKIPTLPVYSDMKYLYRLTKKQG